MFNIFGPKKKNKTIEKVIDIPEEGILICLTDEADSKLQLLQEDNQDAINKFLDDLNKELDEIDLISIYNF